MLAILGVKFDATFAWITLAALVVYIVFTVTVTEWRTKFRKQMNDLDSSSHTKAIDSLLNYETVKYFNNEAFEARRYDESLDKLRRATHEALAAPEMQARLGKLGLRLQSSSSAELQALLAGEIKRWGDVIRAAKIDAE